MQADAAGKDVVACSPRMSDRERRQVILVGQTKMLTVHVEKEDGSVTLWCVSVTTSRTYFQKNVRCFASLGIFRTHLNDFVGKKETPTRRRLAPGEEGVYYCRNSDIQRGLPAVRVFSRPVVLGF